MSQLPGPIPPAGSFGSKPKGETRACDACGRTTLCVTILLRRGKGTGSICIACLGGTLRDLQGDGR